jgi:CubicO group peptidase (beta-lactamase class C family)
MVDQIESVDVAQRERVDVAIDAAIAEERIVGTVVLVIKEGRCIYRRSAGFADREKKVPMQDNHLFRYASATKVVTAIIALALVDQGKLSLDDDVTTWLPTFRPATMDGKTHGITIRHLLTMTSGLSYGISEESVQRYNDADVSNGIDAKGANMSEAMRRLSKAGLMVRPGERWEYSLGLDVLGAVVEKVTKRSFPDALRDLITGPMGIVDMAFELGDAERLAVPYRSGIQGPVRMGDVEPVEFPGFGTIVFYPHRAFKKDVFPSGGAGLIGTADDLARVLDEMCRGGGAFMSSKTAEAMMTNQIGDLPTLLGAGWGWGLGAAVLIDPIEAKTPQSVGTWQWSGAYGNSWFVDPHNQLTVVSMTNTAPEGDIGLYPIMIRDAVYGHG